MQGCFFCKPVTIFAKDSGAMLQAWLIIDKLVAEVWSLAPLQSRGVAVGSGAVPGTLMGQVEIIVLARPPSF